MKKMIFSGFAIFSLLILSSAPAMAYMLDGDISDWGIDLSIDGDGKFNNSWVPSSTTAFYTQSNDVGPLSGKPSGGEAFDAEALYFDSDSNYAYFALVTSANPHGMDLNYPYNYDYDFGSGDLAIKFGVGENDFWKTSTADFGIGIRPVGLPGGTEHRVSASWGLVKKNVGDNLKWYHENGYSWSEFDQAYFDANTGTDVGLLGINDIIWKQWHESNDIGVGYWDSPQTKSGTWVLEARVPISYFGSDWADGREISIRWTPDCVNDYIEVNGVVPEPGSMILLAIGLFCMAAIRKRQ